MGKKGNRANKGGLAGRLGITSGISSDGSTFSNWAGNQVATPLSIEAPTTEDELVAIVRRAAETERTVKAVGAGHSFTDIALTNGVLLNLSGYDQVLSVDGALVTVQAGIRLHALAEILAEHHLALPNLGDIDVQSVAGALSTGTHGTGLGYNAIASAVVGLRVIDGEGYARTLEGEDLRVGRVGLGVAGLISTVTLECVPAFWLHAIEKSAPLAQVLDEFDDWAGETDHTEFFWLPHTDQALTKRNTRLDSGPSRTGGAKRTFRRIETELTENALFDVMCRVGRARPHLAEKLTKTMAAGSTERDYVAPSWEVFATPRRVRFVEMEYAVPRDRWKAAFNEVRGLLDVIDVPVFFPIEVRVLGADDAAMSMATGRDSVFIAVHQYKGMEYERYFRGVESIMKRYEGRPHWGKLHFRSADDLAPVYPEIDRFRDLVHRLDAPGTFRNSYTDRVLGSR